jgi:hypothetical protein
VLAILFCYRRAGHHLLPEGRPYSAPGVRVILYDNMAGHSLLPEGRSSSTTGGWVIPNYRRAVHSSTTGKWIIYRKQFILYYRRAGHPLLQ